MITEQTYDTPVPAPTHTIDVPLARKVLEHLETNPADHRQRAWAMRVDVDDYLDFTVDVEEQLPLGACGTAGCFAGWAAALDGHTVLTSGVLAGVVLDLSDLIVEKDDDGQIQIDYEHSTVVAAAEYARKALGLTESQATRLFSGSNSRADLREYLSDWTNGEIEAERPE